MSGRSGRERLSPEARRDQLIAATVDILAIRGYGTTTADEIARQAGVSKGLLWHYFADLNDLLETTARRILTTLTAAAAARIDLQSPAPAVIRSAIHTAAALRLTHDPERRAMREIAQNLRAPGGGLRFSQADLSELYSAQETIFRRGQEEGDFRDTLDPRFLAVTYEGAVEAMLGYLDAYPNTDADRYADTVADVLLDGVTRERSRDQ